MFLKKTEEKESKLGITACFCCICPPKKIKTESFKTSIIYGISECKLEKTSYRLRLSKKTIKYFFHILTI